MPTEKKVVAITESKEIQSFGKLTQSLAERFEVTPELLINTVKTMCFPQGACTDAQLMMMLSFAKNYDLNPLARECYAFVDSKGRMHIGVQVDGWSKIANREERFDGQEFEYHTDANGDLTAITCKTYVKDRKHPTVYRAALKEWKRNTDVWTSMPMHQLYVKARNEGIRFTFGIPAYDPDDIERIERSAQPKTIETSATPHPTTAVVEEIKTQGGDAKQETVSRDDAQESSTHPPEQPEPIQSDGESAAASPAATPPAGSSDVRKELDDFIARHVTAARLNLLLTQMAKTNVSELSEEEAATLLRRLQKRGGK